VLKRAHPSLLDFSDTQSMYEHFVPVRTTTHSVTLQINQPQKGTVSPYSPKAFLLIAVGHFSRAELFTPNVVHHKLRLQLLVSLELASLFIIFQQHFDV